MTREPREKGLFWPATGWVTLLGAWFFLVYGACNWFTDQRQSGVGQWFWEWEKHIPFIPEFIVPYMSMDLLFVGAFFLCRSRAELRTLVKRLFWVVAASGLCFLLFPLEFGMPRPVPEGWAKPWFEFLHAGDLPYNMAPSLHISLRSIVWITYGRHLRGGLRTVAKIWFVLVGASTLLVWQHHVIDVVTGFLMAWAVVAALPEVKNVWKGEVSAVHKKLSYRYGLAAVACAVLMIPGGAFSFFAWPATALAIMALTYATANEQHLQKINGTLTPAAEWILLPVILVTHAIQRKWLRTDPHLRELTPGVWFGRKVTNLEAKAMLDRGVTAVLDLTAESNAAGLLRERTHYLNLPTLDWTMPSTATLDRGTEFIEAQRHHGQVYLHCQLGLLRSACMAAAWLLKSGTALNAEDAVQQLKAIQPAVVLPADAVHRLDTWNQSGKAST